MDDLYLTLCPYYQDEQSIRLSLFNGNSRNSINQNAYVFSNLSYSAKIENIDISLYKSISFYVNGNAIDTDIDSNGTVRFKDVAYKERIFMDCFGYVQLAFCFIDKNNDEKIYFSDYILILVRKGTQNDSIKRMVNYVYDNQESFLFNHKQQSNDSADLKESDHKTLDSQIRLLWEIASGYEESFSYFKTNARFKTVEKNNIDRFEKLQRVTLDTILFIAQHPEELKKINCKTGIKYNNQHFVPDRTLIQNNESSFDIYENRIVVGFLKTIVKTVDELIGKIQKLISQVPTEVEIIEGYISSSYYIYARTQQILTVNLKELKTLSDRFMILYHSYQKVLNVVDNDIIEIPRPTAILLNVFRYRYLYDMVCKWFKFGIYDLEKERFMLSFMRISTLYECYVLTKFYKYFKKYNFKTVEIERFVYVTSGNYYQNADCNNTFRFINDKQIVTLYYQPVVYLNPGRAVNGIDLFRNTSLSISDDTGIRKGKYYTPDYIIKIEQEGRARYIVMDAKFSSKETVLKCQLPSLVFKYLFSLTPLHPDRDKIIGMNIVNGQSDGEPDGLYNVYDQGYLSDTIEPFVKIMTMTEQAVDNESEHAAILKQCFEAFLV